MFPEGRKPFPSQLAVLSKCLSAFSKKQNVLIESPTGTGKTLALLTAALTYQKREYDAALKHYRETHGEDPGSGSVQATTGLGARTPTEVHLNDVRVHNQLDFPRIYYCSRTHSQIQQVIDELRGLSGVFLEDLHTTILASRSHLCTNPQIRRHAELNHLSIEAACDDALKKNTCGHRSSVIPVVHSLSSGVRGRHGGVSVQRPVPRSGVSAGPAAAHDCGRLLQCNSIWDIEDIVLSGKKHRGCAYFASRAGIVVAAAAASGAEAKAKAAAPGAPNAGTAAAADSKSGPVFPKSHVVFAPYNYMFNPDIREGLGIDLRNSLLVVDEAHNVEDICREEMSVEVTVETLQVTMHRLHAILNHASGMGRLPHFKAFHQLCSDLLVWVRATAAVVAQGTQGAGAGQGRGGFTMPVDNVWHGEEIMTTLGACCSLSAESLPMYLEHFGRLKEQEDISYSMAMHSVAQQEREGEREGVNGAAAAAAAAAVEKDEWQLPKPSVSLISGEYCSPSLYCCLGSAVMCVSCVFRSLVQLS